MEVPGPATTGAGAVFPVLYRLDFARLGISVRRDMTTAPPYGHNRDFILGQAQVEGHLLLPAPASPLLQLWQRLVTAIAHPSTELHLRVIEDARSNAYALCGSDTVCVTTGLLQKPNLSEGELAYVLGHELGHLLKFRPRSVPARFKNPLFRQAVMAGTSAGEQAEEYQADELGLLIADAAGYSVREGRTMVEWLASSGGEPHTAGKTVADTERTATRVLTPGESHPHTGARASAVAAALRDPRFCWHNLEVARQPLPFDETAFTRSTATPTHDWNTQIHDSLAPETIATIAQHPCYRDQALQAETMVVVFHYDLCLQPIPITEATQAALRNFRTAAETGDLVALLYFQALLCTLYGDTVYDGEAARTRLAWLAEAGVEANEVLGALISYAHAAKRWVATARKKKRYAETEDGDQDEEKGLSAGPDPYDDVLYPRLTLATHLTPFPPSRLRDEYIRALLRMPELIADADQILESPYFDSRHSHDQLQFPLTEYHLTDRGLLTLLPLLHSATFIDLVPIIAHMLSIEKEPATDEEGHTTAVTIASHAEFQQSLVHTYDDEGFALFDCTWDERLTTLLWYIAATGGPYHRSALEDALAESYRVRQELTDEPDSTTRWTTIQGIYCWAYQAISSAGTRLAIPFQQDRVAEVARLVLLRGLEHVPATAWNEGTVAVVTALPPSNERNHLLVLFAQAGRYTIGANDVVFYEVPSPDAQGAMGGHNPLLDSFGFVASGEVEVVYPSGQRALDHYRAQQLPATGPLLLTDILVTIPRASPVRDELLDRCDADDTATARRLLDAYWSPAAAYSKAYALTSQWLATAGGAPATLDAILTTTSEFPSLRRRMVTSWTDRFGIDTTTYPELLAAREEVDAVDLYCGGTVGQVRNSDGQTKATLALASFASALTRDGNYALLTLHDVEEKERPARVRPKWDDDDDVEETPSRGIDAANDADVVDLKERKKKRRARELTALLQDYHPFLPEEASTLVHLLATRTYYEVHHIPFVDGRPVPNPRFLRGKLLAEGVAALKRWDGGKAFSRFMQAMGWQEAVVFYEELLMGEQGVMENRHLFQAIENIWFEGIGLLLEEKGVPLARVAQVQQGLETLLAKQPHTVRGAIWARILAGIAQQLSLGEIVREAVRPLGAAGGKLMQAIHSLTVGIDATLEEATRMALDDTANFTLFDALQFLGSRDVTPFQHHQRYQLLGQGSVRAALAGEDGPDEDCAYLLVHAQPAAPRVVAGIQAFIHALQANGTYFPLTSGQFVTLVEQTDAERLRGFVHHAEFAALHGGRLGAVRIPAIRDAHDDWARVELIRGAPYTALTAPQQREVAHAVMTAAAAQLTTPTVAGALLINPEMHGGNILYDSASGETALVDCGLLGLATFADREAFLGITVAFAGGGLTGGVAAILVQQGHPTLESLSTAAQTDLLCSLTTLSNQLTTGIPPELVMPGATALVARVTGVAITPGLETLFRGLQHLAPYLRAVDTLPPLLHTKRPLGPAVTTLANAIEASWHPAGGTAVSTIIPSGMGVGRILKSGQVQSLGVLKAALDPAKPDPTTKLLCCVLADSRQFVRPADLRIQVADAHDSRWVPLEEYLSARSVSGI